MMKKLMVTASLLLCICLFSGCQLIDYNKKKPSNHYYTGELCSLIDKNDDFSVILFQSNLYKKVDVTNESIPVLKNFIKELNSHSFLNDMPSDLPKIPVYKLFITFNGKKFVVNIYNDEFISVYDWDGIINEDYVSMKNIHTAYNLFGFCQYIFTIQ